MIWWIQDVFRAMAWVATKILFRVRVHGADRVPRSGAFLVVANHVSYADPPLLGTYLPRRFRFLARSTLGKRRAMGAFLRSLGTIFVDRDAPTRASMQATLDALASGAPVILFPEGTRSIDGSIGEFRRGVELLARRSDVPVVPVGIRGMRGAWPRGARLPRFHKVEVHVGQPLTAAAIVAVGGVEQLRAQIAALAAAPLAARAVDVAEPPRNDAEPSARSMTSAPASTSPKNAAPQSSASKSDAGQNAPSAEPSDTEHRETGLDSVVEDRPSRPVRRRSDGPTATRNT